MSTGHHGPRASLNFQHRKKAEAFLLLRCHAVGPGFCKYDEGHNDTTVAAETGAEIGKYVSPVSIANLRNALLGTVRQGGGRHPQLPFGASQAAMEAVQNRLTAAEARIATLSAALATSNARIGRMETLLAKPTPINRWNFHPTQPGVEQP